MDTYEDEKTQCPRCGGRGTTLEYSEGTSGYTCSNDDGGFYRRTCDRCKGRGYIWVKKCKNCGEPLES